MSTDKNKKNSSLTSASMLVSNALQGRKAKLPINTILEEQNVTPAPEKTNHSETATTEPVKPIQENGSNPGDLLPKQETDRVGDGKPSASVEVVPVIQGEKDNHQDNNKDTITPGKGEVEPVKSSTEKLIQKEAPEGELSNSGKKNKQKANFERFLTANRNVNKGKAVYIRTDYHSEIENIISTIGNKGLTLAAYIDHVLTAHFEQFGDVIKDKQHEALLASLEKFKR
jgi:hypothetical protein